MDTPRPPEKGFPFGRTIVAVVLVAVFALLIAPDINDAIWKGRATHALSSARMIQIAMLRVTSDAGAKEVADPKLGWPGDVPDIKSVSDFVERLITYEYIAREDVASVFSVTASATGVKPYPGTGPFLPENSAFKVYKVKENDVSQVIFLATKNFTFGQPLDEKAVPFGKRHAVLFRKGGEGVIINDQQAANSGSGNLGFNPGGTSMEDPGPPSVPLL
jgi:hypothetical protein